MNKDETIKIILLGESGVGKTNLINVFFDLDFQELNISILSSNGIEGNYKYKSKSYKYSI